PLARRDSVSSRPTKRLPLSHALSGRAAGLPARDPRAQAYRATRGISWTSCRMPFLLGHRRATGRGGCGGGCSLSMALAWVHPGLAVRDLDRAIAFYQAAFGYEVVFSECGISREIAEVTGLDGQVCDLVQLRSPYSGHVLELLQFHGFETSESGLPQAPLRPG